MKSYVFIYLDATFIVIKRDNVSKELFAYAFNIREDGIKESGAYTSTPTESATIF
ncbi:hypothetical protein [Bacillus sp. JCM 19041]|uniref:hypothetical protein n=1 Tax=Bacillus sp. JCM 19041 TaxID=1460637 RepID=UPI000AD28C82